MQHETAAKIALPCVAVVLPTGIAALPADTPPSPTGITPSPTGIAPSPAGTDPSPTGIALIPAGIAPKLLVVTTSSLTTPHPINGKNIITETRNNRLFLAF